MIEAECFIIPYPALAYVQHQVATPGPRPDAAVIEKFASEHRRQSLSQGKGSKSLIIIEANT